MSSYDTLLARTVATLNLHQTDVLQLDDEALRQMVCEGLNAQLRSGEHWQIEGTEADLSQRVIDDIVGLGPLEGLLRDPQISEIMVNRFDQIYVERAGCLQNSPLSFRNESALRQVIDRIVAPLGRRIDASSPMVDARLANGARVNAVIPPLAVAGACLTIRKFSSQRLTMNTLIASGSVSSSLAALLRLGVKLRRNILISGGTGSGKTTLLNILADSVRADERIITIEDAAELKLDHDNLVALEARPANQEGAGAVTIRQLVMNALRMRPDRIVVGECRGGESLDMLQAMNTGHAGSMTTLHANTPRDALSRLETMVLMAGLDLPLHAVRQQIAGAIDWIVQIGRMADGKRRVLSLTEVRGQAGDVMQLAEIIRFESCSGQHHWLGEVPELFNELDEATKQSLLEQLQAQCRHD